MPDDSTNDILHNAAYYMVETDPSIDYYEAKRRITAHTGFPAQPHKQRDISYASKRLSWDSYFMSLAFLVAMRSPDAQTQHGSVIIDKNNRILSTGYNGWISGAPDSDMPNLRPEKYLHVIHSEINAILSAKQDLNGCQIYITGLPCNECLKVIASVGIKDIVVGDRQHVYPEGYLEMQAFLCASQQINIRKFTGTLAKLDGRTIS